MFLKSTLCAVALFSALAFPFSAMQAETFNGPTTLKDKAFDDLTINGPAKLIKVRAKSLTVKGPMKFYQLDVQGMATVDGPAKGAMGKFQDLNIKGPFKARKITVKTLNVAGAANLMFFTIMDNSVISGPLKAKKGSFQDLTVGPDFGARGKVMLDNVSIKNLVIKTEDGEEMLELEDDSDVSGTITFESKKGKVEKKAGELKKAGAASSAAPKK